MQSNKQSGSRIRGAVRFLFRWTLALVILPLLLLGGFEAGLRLAGYGHDLKPFLALQYRGHAWYRRNLAFLQQFLSWRQELCNSGWDEAIFALPAQKPENTYRIFVFGGSAAQGWPDANYAFSRLLKAMLHARFPGVRFEVYNTAYMCMNSHIMREAARQAAALQPDLFLVYMGNNEFYGPFGPVYGVAATRHLMHPALIQARIRGSNLRLFQLAHGPRYGRPPSESMRNVFDSSHLYPSDSVVEGVFGRYEANLRAICRYGEEAEARLLLGTVGVNLMWPPNNPVHMKELTQKERAAWEDVWDEGGTLQAAGQYRKALTAYTEAAALDDTYSELHFRMGECLIALEDFEKARECLTRSLELDNFEWVRAKPRINEIIRAASGDLPHVFLADVVDALSAAAPGGIPGFDMFPDSCHLNLHGSHVAASAFFRALVPVLPAWIRDKGADNPEPLPETECVQLLCITLDERKKALRTAVSGSWMMGRELLAMLEEKIAALDTASHPAITLASCREAVTVMPEDFRIRLELIEMLNSGGRFEEALEEAAIFSEYHPVMPRARACHVSQLIDLQKYRAAAAESEELTRLFPEEPAIWFQRAEIWWQTGEHDRTIECCRRAIACRPADTLPLMQTSSYLRDMGRYDEAADLLVKAIEMQPESMPACEKLDSLFGAGKKLSDRLAFWEAFCGAHPDAAAPRRFLARALRDREAYERAIAEYRGLAENAPLIPGLHAELAETLRLAGREEEAVAAYRQAIALEPENQAAAQGLAAIRGWEDR
jgi:tetratricopeptide (TPR) repeat protein